jgi:hypothetical protein
MFRTWITKLVSHFNGTNRETTVKNKNVCPNCNCVDKSTSLYRCPDLGRRKVRSEREAVKELRNLGSG